MGNKLKMFYISLESQILQMLNDSNPGVREAAIMCIEVSSTAVLDLYFEFDLFYKKFVM